MNPGPLAPQVRTLPLDQRSKLTPFSLFDSVHLLSPGPGAAVCQIRLTFQKRARFDTARPRVPRISFLQSLCHQDLPPGPRLRNLGRLGAGGEGAPGPRGGSLGDSNRRLGRSRPPIGEARAVSLAPKPCLLCSQKGGLGSGADSEAPGFGQARPLVGSAPKAPARLWVPRNPFLCPGAGHSPATLPPQWHPWLDGCVGPRGAALVFPHGWAVFWKPTGKEEVACAVTPPPPAPGHWGPPLQQVLWVFLVHTPLSAPKPGVGWGGGYAEWG